MQPIDGLLCKCSNRFPLSALLMPLAEALRQASGRRTARVVVPGCSPDDGLPSLVWYRNDGSHPSGPESLGLSVRLTVSVTPLLPTTVTECHLCQRLNIYLPPPTPLLNPCNSTKGTRCTCKTWQLSWNRFNGDDDDETRDGSWTWPHDGCDVEVCLLLKHAAYNTWVLGPVAC
jgi:hypothetical protein